MSDPIRGSRISRPFVALLVLAILASIPAALWWTGDRRVEQVGVAVSVPQCEGTEPTTARDSDSTFTAEAIPLTAGFSCTLSMKLINRGGREVTLDRVTIPIAGPDATAALQVTHIGGVEVDDNTTDSAAAVVELGLPLDPGTEQLVDLEVVFRSSGCTAPGALKVVPEVDLSALLASRQLAADDMPYFLGTDDSSCRN